MGEGEGKGRKGKGRGGKGEGRKGKIRVLNHPSSNITRSGKLV